jgi:arylsulfatase A
MLNHTLQMKSSIIFSSTVITAVFLSSCKQQPEIARPNIILVFADDLGYGDVGCFGQQVIKTPNIDNMASEGIKLTRFYSAFPVCAPSRSSLMTGKHAGESYIRHNMNVLPMGQMPLRPDDFTVAELLKEQGYATAAFGKWSLGAPGNSGDPQKQGFDDFFGYYCQCYAHNYYPEILWKNGDTIRLSNETVPVKVNYIDYPLSYATKKVEYSADIIFDEAKVFIENNNENPFFLYYATALPHSNGEAPVDEKFEIPDWGIYGDTLTYPDWTPQERGYAAMVTLLDKQVGEIRAMLDELGIAENTLLIFTSDNGATKFAARFNSNGNLRGRKRDLYEGGIREPFVACWPGKIKQGTESNIPATTYDLMATFADISGYSNPFHSNGSSLVPLLTRLETPEQRPLYWEFYEGKNAPVQAVINDEWKLVRFRFDDEHGQFVELYNLNSDEGETNNIAENNPDKVAELIRIMNDQHTVYEHRLVDPK